MSSRINTFENVISPELCREAIDLYNETLKPKATRRSENLYGSVVQINIEHDNPYWDVLVKKFRDEAEKYIAEFLSFETNLFNLSSYKFAHAGINETKEGDCVPYHQDMEVTTENGEVKLSHFAVLCYLNDDFEGGELVFPHQKTTITPKQGLVVVFPTSYLYPHVVTPVFGNSRYVLRLTYYHANFPMKEK